MTAIPHLPAPAGLLSLADWEALPESEFNRIELQEGVLIVSPRPKPEHQETLGELYVQLRAQIPPGVKVYLEIDVIIDGDHPPTVRVPDLALVDAHAPEPITAESVVVAIEIVSPGTARMDLVTKRSEYAGAGIPHYWIVHPDHTLTALELRDGGYTETARALGSFHTDVPFPLTIDLTALPA